MSIKLKNTSVDLSNKKLSVSPKGYDPLQVDALLDEIIADYELVESNNLLTSEELNNIKEKLDALEKENLKLRIELDGQKDKWKYVNLDSNDVHIDNLVLLKRIGKLEKYIYEKLHVSPDDIN